jgi:hypothetical protein
LVRQSFDHVNSRRWDELLKAVAPDVHHRFGGSHSIDGERHDKEAMRWMCLKTHKKWTVVLPPKLQLASERRSPTKL